MDKNIETEKLHWVVRCQRDGFISHFLGNEENKALGYPMLRGLTNDEKKQLNESEVCWEYDEGSFLYIHCLPRENCPEIAITAPVYVEVCKKGEPIQYQRMGYCVKEWTDLDEIRRVNKIVEKIIPKEKVHIPGCYVDIEG